MNKITPYKQENGLAEADLPYPIGYRDGYPDEYYDAGYQDDEKALVKGIISTLLRHWFLIVSINLLVTAFVIVYAAQEPDYYRTGARVQVNAENNPAAGATAGGRPIIVNNQGSDPAYFSTQLQILEGSGLLRRVVKTLDLEHNQDFLNPDKNNRLTVFQNVLKMFGFYSPPVNRAVSQKSPEVSDKLSIAEPEVLDIDEEVQKLAPYVSLLKRGLLVSPVRDRRSPTGATRLIDIDFTHRKPEVAAKVANAISDAYVLQNLETKIQSNASAGDFLRKRVAELQSAIRRGEERLLNYAKRNQIISLDSSQNTIVQRLSSLNGQLGAAQNDRIAAQAAYQAAMQNQLWTTSAQSKDSRVVALEGKLSDLEQKLAQLKTEYTDEWFEVVQTRKQIKGVEDQLAAIRKRASDTQLAALKEALISATTRENTLRKNFDLQRAEVIRQNEAAINYKIIQQEISTNQALLNGLLQRSKENEVIMTGTPNNVLVLDRALKPNAPAGPRRTRSILLAFVASLGLGIGLAFMIDWFDETISHEEDVEGKLGFPVLGLIPRAPLTLSQRITHPKLPLVKRRLNGKKHYDLEVYERPHFLESYMQLAAYLLLTNSADPPKTVLITSAEEGEGKTMTSLNLARSLARTRGKVLIIDADLRRPQIHKITRLSNDLGLSSLLESGEASAEEIENCIQKDSDTDLDILVAGETRYRAGHALPSEAMEALLAKLEPHYSHIIIDSPPALYFADSAVISTLVDSVVVIVRDSFSSSKAILKGMSTLQKVGANVIGVVLNGVPVAQTNYYGYTSYDSEDVSQVNGSEKIFP